GCWSPPGSPGRPPNTRGTATHRPCVPVPRPDQGRCSRRAWLNLSRCAGGKCLVWQAWPAAPPPGGGSPAPNSAAAPTPRTSSGTACTPGTPKRPRPPRRAAPGREGQLPGGPMGAGCLAMEPDDAAERARQRDLVRRGYDAISLAYRGDDSEAAP